MTPRPNTPERRPGRKPETLKIEGDWKDAVAHALKRGTPPKPAKKSTANKKRRPK